ncbi:hypothetical protein SAMN06265174_106151 [Dietzia kunjamensis subsp. schimae]|uniref:DNA-binding transcriptional regulator of glucitol operon n=1 Tax=Dietzia kunjamensis subsp. schimae TaxID=498198 RepID=A0ABY1N2U4_9ACTN|nr:hypothetical protein [Dietzia kunjamensis]SMO80239.1 hypothetical protein SAMN06265174_106151 [Dietzia kunjamensis subsp. schimae]
MSLPCGQRYRGGVSDTLGSHATGSVTRSGDPAPTAVRHRPAWIAFVVLGAIFCMGMGLWQLARYQEATGTAQNLGYTFMWPFLAGFLIYAYLKYVRMEADEGDRIAAADGVDGGHREGDDAEDDGDDGEVAQPSGVTATTGKNRTGRRRGPVVTEIPSDLLPTRRPARDEAVRDEGLDAYNSYLAELARKDRADGTQQEKPAS